MLASEVCPSQSSEVPDAKEMSRSSWVIAICPYRFPRVFGDEIGDKFGDKLSDSPNLVKNLVTILVKNLVNHHILCQIQ